MLQYLSLSHRISLSMTGAGTQGPLDTINNVWRPMTKQSAIRHQIETRQHTTIRLTWIEDQQTT